MSIPDRTGRDISAAGSAWAKLPPTVEELRIVRCATCRSACRNIGATRATSSGASGCDMWTMTPMLTESASTTMRSISAQQIERVPQVRGRSVGERGGFHGAVPIIEFSKSVRFPRSPLVGRPQPGLVLCCLWLRLK